ncbi:LPS export ABC transporter periplasmic protein LptC [Tepidimonas taiwanensis]|uniref:LPS export ABC transporter periplasmic protein LptC n=1 Tax=Tepidimonas taiwanensis TaxID=307486 RepID=UPI00068E706C|nr:LPS export ABC transporter periplasmic protein LptC [Tepidimonas taiwanensis]
MTDGTPPAAAGPVTAARPTAPRRRWHGLWDRVSLYLPVLLMGALAAISYGIVQRLPPLPAAPDAPVAPGAPDYRLEDFVLRRYDAAGRLESTLRGQALAHYPDRAVLLVQEADLERWARADGHRLWARAHALQTDDARTVVHLRGDVRVVREALAGTPQTKTTPRLTFEGQALTWHETQRLLESDQPVRVTRGADVLTGDRLRYDEARGVADVTGRVRATLAARP